MTGEKGLEGRVRRLEADVLAQERELERLLRLATVAETAGVGGIGGDPGSTDAGAKEIAAVGPGSSASGGMLTEGPRRKTEGSLEGIWRGLELPPGLANLRRWEWWLNKVGIALFLMGVVFLFKFSWDRGWLQVFLTPAVRVGLGLLLGSALVWVGLRVYAERRAFAQVVLGGGIGAYYITGFAAYGMLGLFSYPVAFAFMVVVTLLAFALALRQDGSALAVIGVSGGLATPLLLYDGTGAVWGLVLYAGLVLTGAMGVYLYKGWTSLLMTSFCGYWLVLLTGYAGADPGGGPPVSEALALQAGVVFGWISFSLLPAAREAHGSADPNRRWAPGRSRLPEEWTAARVLTLASPGVSLWTTHLLWNPDATTIGFVALGLAATHGLASIGFRRVEGAGLVSYAQAVAALLLATLSLPFLLEGGTLVFALAAGAAALHFVVRRFPDRICSSVGHALFAVAGAWVFSAVSIGAIERSFDPYATLPFSGWDAPVGLAVVAFAFASSVALAEPELRRAYRVLAHAALTALLFCELVPLDGGSWALAALALYATGLHALSRRRPEWGTVVGAHVLSAFVCLWLSGRLVAGALSPGEYGTAVFNVRGIADFGVASAILASSRFVVWRRAVAAYRIPAHAALLLWSWRELSMLPGAPDAYITVAWGLAGAAMFVAGLRTDHAHLIKGGVATLFLVVAKLFLWDLAGLEPALRAVLFLGFGGLFLLLSFHLRNLWRPRESRSTASHPPEGQPHTES